MQRTRRLVAAATVIGAAGIVGVAAPTAEAAQCNRNNNNIAKLTECVTVDGVMRHQQAFQDIADANEGTRASGTPGYDASVDYVADTLKAAGYR